MALAGRSTRRGGGGSRLLIVALVITLLVLLVDASIKSRSTDSAQRLSAEAWIDQTLPLIRDSTAQGRQLGSVRTAWQTMSASTIAGQLKKTASEARDTYRAAKKLVPPASYGSAGGLLDACLLVREQAATAMARTLVATLSGPPTPSQAHATALASAGQKLQLGDQVYHLFAQSLPGLNVQMPPSTWSSDATLYQPAALTVYLAALRSKTSLAPVHRVALEAFSTNPAAETVLNNVQVIPYEPTMSVSVVVANTGNQVERNVTVTASAYPSVRQPRLRKFLDPLQPGDPVSLTIGPLYPLRGQPVILTITVAGSSDLPSVTKKMTFEMPAAGTALTTTTTTAPPAKNAAPGTTTPGSDVSPGSTTTVAGGGGGGGQGGGGKQGISGR